MIAAQHQRHDPGREPGEMVGQFAAEAEPMARNRTVPNPITLFMA